MSLDVDVFVLMKDNQTVGTVMITDFCRWVLCGTRGRRGDEQQTRVQTAKEITATTTQQPWDIHRDLISESRDVNHW